MNIVKLENLDLKVVAFPRRPEGEDPIRTKGLHLTDIIRDIMEESGLKRTNSGVFWQPDQLDLAAEVGFMWEEILSSALKERLPCRLGEVELDGIIMSPDGVEVYEDEPILSEYKAVWASSNKSPADNWKWMAQVKGYCKALGFTKVRMYILHLNGDWKGGGPQYKGCLIEFSQMEIDENWDMIVNHAQNKGWLK